MHSTWRNLFVANSWIFPNKCNIKATVYFLSQRLEFKVTRAFHSKNSSYKREHLNFFGIAKSDFYWHVCPKIQPSKKPICVSFPAIYHSHQTSEPTFLAKITLKFYLAPPNSQTTYKGNLRIWLVLFHFRIEYELLRQCNIEWSDIIDEFLRKYGCLAGLPFLLKNVQQN